MFKVNNEDSRMTPVSLLLTLNGTDFIPYSSVSIVNFEHAIAGWKFLEIAVQLLLRFFLKKLLMKKKKNTSP